MIIELHMELGANEASEKVENQMHGFPVSGRWAQVQANSGPARPAMFPLAVATLEGALQHIGRASKSVKMAKIGADVDLREVMRRDPPGLVAHSEVVCLVASSEGIGPEVLRDGIRPPFLSMNDGRSGGLLQVSHTFFGNAVCMMRTNSTERDCLPLSFAVIHPALLGKSPIVCMPVFDENPSGGRE